MLEGDLVYWQDGMFLLPQHLQYADHKALERLEALGARLDPLAWGVKEIEYSHAALKERQFRATRLAAVFPDGAEFAPSERDLALPELPIQALKQGAASVTVHLVLPKRHDRLNVRSGPPRPGEERVRWSVRSAALRDVFDPTDPRPVDLVHLAPELKLGPVVGGDADAIPLARFLVDPGAKGEVRPDPDFIPPAAQIRHSPSLCALLKDVRSALRDKASQLKKKVPAIDRNEGATPLSSVQFQILRIVNRAAASVDQLVEPGVDHPRHAYRLLVETCAELASFQGGNLPEPLRTYDHLDCGPRFKEAQNELVKLLSVMFADRARPLPFYREQTISRSCWKCGAEIGDEAAQKCHKCAAELFDADSGQNLCAAKPINLWVVKDVEDRDLDLENSFYLEIRSKLAPTQVQRLVARGLVKFGALSDVYYRLRPLAYSGVGLDHVERIPDDMTRQPDCTYFLVKVRDEHLRIDEKWSLIRREDPPTIDCGEEQIEGFALVVVAAAGGGSVRA